MYLFWHEIMLHHQGIKSKGIEPEFLFNCTMSRQEAFISRGTQIINSIAFTLSNLFLKAISSTQVYYFF